MEAFLEPLYELIEQQPWCCVPTCVQMILQRRELSFESQEDIGKELGLVVPEDQLHLFKTIESGPEPPAGYGTRINEPEFSLDTYFTRHNLPLSCEYVSGSAVENIEEFVVGHLESGNDILTCFRIRHLYDIKEAGDCGHASLVQGINKDTLILTDPHGINRGVDVNKFYESVLAHRKGDLELGGFWVISSE